MNIMILAGAGTSIELGVPAMVGMAREFLVHAEQWDVEPKLVHEIMGKELDIEYLIDGLDRICSAASSLERIGQNTSNLKRISDIRAEVEWFVQHAAERIVPVEAELMWGGVLRQSVNHTLSLITTNYDRAIELAANAVEIQINDGFNRVDSGEHSDWNGFELNQSGVLLAKLHGSTDWYEEIDTNTAIKLRHPMPLFGGARLRVSGGKELGSALVLPSREKLLTHTPYPRLSQTFLNSTDEC
ncbi:MAG: SIR2 family protein, partial [Pseudomonadales bacterium]|nr:SIR2 family protein [Pseudomonadales bacterium]